MTEETGRHVSTPFYKRRAVVVTAAILVILVVTVITDLPEHSTLAAQYTDDKSVMQQVNADLASCSFAANESFTIYADQKTHSLSQSDISRVPGLLSDDQSACSFTSESIYDLSSDIEVPGSSSGKPLGQMVGTVTLWATSDALSAIESIQTLFDHPSNVSALGQLVKEENLLASDRSQAEAELAAADKVLGKNLPGLNIASLPDPGN